MLFKVTFNTRTNLYPFKFDATRTNLVSIITSNLEVGLADRETDTKRGKKTKTKKQRQRKRERERGEEEREGREKENMSIACTYQSGVSS